MVFKCDKCGQEFDARWKLNRHLSRITSCEPVIDGDHQNPLTCRYCGRTFSRKSTLTRHIQNSCKVYKNKNLLFEHVRKKEQNKDIKQLKKELKKSEKNREKDREEMKQQLEELKNIIMSRDASSSSTSSTSNTSNTSNTANTSTVANTDNNHHNTNNTNVNTTINNNTVNNNINIAPQITYFDAGAMRDVIKEFLESDTLKASNFITLIKTYLKKNKVEDLAKIVMMTLHNNPDIPNGQNILHCDSGPYEGSILSYQANGWSETDLQFMVNTILGEICQIVGQIGYDENHKKTKKCIETFNSGEFVSSYSVELLDIVKKFGKSKEEPPKEVSNKKMIQSRIDKKKKEQKQKEFEERIKEMQQLSLKRAEEAAEEDSDDRSSMDEWEKSVGMKLPKSLGQYKAGEFEDETEWN